MGQQHLVLQFAALEEHAFAADWRDGLHMVVVVNPQFPTVVFLPPGIQVEDHRIRPALVVLELVEVFFIKSPLFVQGIVKFIPRDAGIAGAVQIPDKGVHPVEKSIFVRVVVRPVEPENLVASGPLVLREAFSVSDARRPELVAGMEGQYIFF